MAGIWKRRWYHQNMGFAGCNEHSPSQILRKFSTRYAWINHLDILFCCSVYLTVNDICIHPNQGEVISCDQAGSIKQWDLSDNICSHELTPAGDIPIKSITLAADGSCLVAGNNKGQCYVWKVNDENSGLPRFQAVTRFLAHGKYLTRCLLSPDARYLATCSADTTVKVWSISSNYDFKQEKVLIGHQRWVWDCAFSADSAYLVTASSDHTARLWEMSSGETVRQYNGHHKAAVCCALHDGAS